MDTRIPASLHPLLDAYLHGLEPFSQHLAGLYLYGSIALGAFEEPASDIDVVALTKGEWSPPELKRLAALHKHLSDTYPFGKRLEVYYIPTRYLGVLHPDQQQSGLAPYPTARDGTFSPATLEGLNAVTWWTIQHHGIRLLGPACDALPLDVAWQEVLTTMRFNLDGYFARKARQPYIFWFDAGVEFAVTNMCRILSTIEEGEIISKSAALTRWRTRLPERWQPLLDDAWRIRHRLGRPALYPHRLPRLRDTLAFIQYGRERGGTALKAAGV